MIDTLITLVIILVIVGIIALFLRWVMPQLGIPEPIVKIVWVVFALIVFLVILGLLFGLGPWKAGVKA